MDTDEDEDILVEMRKDNWMRLSQNDLGLCVYDEKSGFINCSVKDSNNSLKTYYFLQTVAENSNQHAAKERKLAHQANSLSKRLGIPLRKFNKYLNNNYMRNTSITSKDVRRTENTHVKEVMRLRSSSMRSKSKSVRTMQDRVLRTENRNI